MDLSLYRDSPYAGTCLLSCTLAPALVQNQALTASGQVRAGLTEYGGAATQLVASPVGEFPGYEAPSPVPGSLALSGAGLAALGGARRHRRR